MRTLYLSMLCLVFCTQGALAAEPSLDAHNRNEVVGESKAALSRTMGEFAQLNERGARMMRTQEAMIRRAGELRDLWQVFYNQVDEARPYFARQERDETRFAEAQDAYNQACVETGLTDTPTCTAAGKHLAEQLEPLNREREHNAVLHEALEHRRGELRDLTQSFATKVQALRDEGEMFVSHYEALKQQLTSAGAGLELAAWGFEMCRDKQSADVAGEALSAACGTPIDRAGAAGLAHPSVPLPSFRFYSGSDFCTARNEICLAPI